MGILKLINHFCAKSFQNNPDNAIVPVAYNNINIGYSGRWIDTGSGKWSGWGGSKLSFKIKNTNFIKVYYSYTDGSAADNLAASIFVDGSVATKLTLTTTAEVSSGTTSKTFAVPCNDSYHTVEFYQYALGAFLFGLTSQIIITGIEIGSAGSIIAWTQGSTIIQCIGDSWMVGDASWIKYLNRSTYNIYPVSNTGYKCSDANTNYLYDYTGVLNSTDPTPNKVLISFGVNDYNASVSVASFQTSLLALIDKIRIRWTGVPIVLVRVPNNVGSGETYGQYGTAMSNAVGLRANVTYIDTTAIDASVTWKSDNSHLDDNGLLVMSQFVQPLIA